MNTNQLKKFAQEARRKLIDQVASRLNYVLNTDSAELREKSAAISNLREALKNVTKEQLIDKVAYTWFNRFVALRFMDVNDYQPNGVRVVSTLEEFTTPEILDEAKRGHIHDEIQVDRRKIGDLLDGRIPSSNAQNEVYKLLLTGVCNHLHKTFPFLFERIDDYTELLLPDDLTSEFSIIQDIRNGMSKEDCEEVEIIGWLYQFYISEKKDEVFASNEKVKKEDIPAATQLFTPRWIVEYMVQNTVGKLWLLNNPTSKLKDHMPYYIESAEKDDDFLKIDSVEEITLLDQACGSGHILVYGFELLTKIYEEEGYNTSEIPQLIINKNLFGFEIDERAAQLSGFALLMKAREYNRRVFRKELKPNILCYKDLKLTEEEIKETFTQLKVELTDELLFDLKNIQQATNLGSLISPHSDTTSIQAVIDKVVTSKSSSDVFLRYRLEELEVSLKHLLLLSNKYHCVVDNPPYMGGGKMNKHLSDWVKTNYQSSKSDLLTCFIERSYNQVIPKGYLGFVTMESWMFLSSFEQFRKTLLKDHQIESLSHFGWHIMRIAFGTCSFILKSHTSKSSIKGTYNYMEFDNIDKSIERPKEFPLKDNGRYNHVNQKDFSKIPGSPIGYWLSENFLKIFDFKKVDQVSDPRLGMATADNNRFLRLIWEPDSQKVNSENSKKWYPYAKGGEYRKWFGNLEYVVNWENNGHEIRNFTDSNGKVRSHNYNLEYIFKRGISWNALSSKSTSFRILIDSLFDNAGSSLFLKNPNDYDYYSILGLLNSKLISNILPVINPTLNYQPGTIGKIPIKHENIDITIIQKCIEISRIEYSNSELASEFRRHYFLCESGNDLDDLFSLYKQYWTTKFVQLHRKEEELNRQFIDIYGLQDELTPDVPLEDITILKEEISIVSGELVFDQEEVFSQFISYAVGCMFGRYSLDKEGLILANQGETLQDYLLKVEKQESELSFVLDDDNIIPILDDEWFEDDIVGRFYAFLKASFGEQNFEKNLSFVEDSLGKDIRKYFVKDFYKDHIKRYKKRPIYWMFSSPKGSFNVLVYMHRYTPDTLNQVLNGYLNEYREKLKTRIETLDHLMVSGSPSEQNKASKEKDKIQLVLLELQEYERETLYPLATERISIDLDDGVLVNYNKFGDAIAAVAGLNDKKAKEKVKKFDWIDTTMIR
ncbi:BREX-1 system adenine-specific DNA-methyltransferase PglX [Flavobacteriaceae bacterium]|nr:BREX-1 system adenine-specific DNA-methyltransferase PglX [Flavobacteriaceae bacterium]